MTPERWQRIDDLLQETVKRPRRERAAFLDEVCADEASREEIESLISFHEQAEDFLEVPAFEAAANLLADQGESLVGLVVGAYKIEKLLGAGGMGEVYLAEDTKLDRKVAIKFLPPYLEADELAKRRLIREAKAVAKLDHPNICATYEVAEEAGRSFIVMQHVEGETLAARIQRKPLELDESLDVAIQVADALAEAHSHGIIHRDIKPHNIIITRRGQVKVLDFGLAKMVRATGLPQNEGPMQSLLSVPGLIVGTAPYMSPEQAKGSLVDTRSDLFSIGVVLYECIAGRPPFAGATAMEICSRVIHVNPPPPSHFNPTASPELDALIVKALAKEPNARYQSASELLENLLAVRAIGQADDHVQTKQISPAPRTTKVRASATFSNVVRAPRVIIPIGSLALLAVALIVMRLPTWLRAAPYSPRPEAIQWYNQGINALRNGLPYQASKALQQAIKESDEFALAHARLAEAMTELDYSEKASQEIANARMLLPNLSVLPKLDALHIQAINETVSYHFDRAIKSYQEIARGVQDSEKAYAYLDLGRAYEKNDQIDEAIESYRRTTDLAPEDPAAFLRLGILYSRKTDLPSAYIAFQRARDIYDAQTNNEGVTEVLYWRGVFFVGLGRLDEARRELAESLDRARASGNKHQQIRTLLQLSNVSCIEHITKAAEQYANLAIDLAQKNNIENLSTHGLIDLGNTYLTRGIDYDRAEQYLQKAIDYARQNKGRRNEADAAFSLGNLHIERHDPDGALPHIEQAIEFYERGSYRNELSKARILQARAKAMKGDYDGALFVYDQLLQAARSINDPVRIARAQGDIGNTLNQTEQYSEARPHLDESIEIYKSLNHRSYSGYGLADLGDTLWQLGHYDEATEALRQASLLADQPDADENLRLRAKIALINSNLMLSKRRGAEAIAAARLALELNADLEPEADARYILGLAQALMGQTRKGLATCRQAIQTATRFNDAGLLPKAQLALAEVMLEDGDAQGALANALDAQVKLAQTKRQESEWRAWLVAGLASQRMGDFATARDYLAHARDLFEGLKVTWGTEPYNFYLTRPDVQYSRQQLSEALDVNK